MKSFCLTKLIAVILLICTNESIYGQYKLDGFALFNPKFGFYGSFKGGLPGYVFGDEINFLKKKMITTGTASVKDLRHLPWWLAPVPALARTLFYVSQDGIVVITIGKAIP